jgi:hypothetical protein
MSDWYSGITNGLSNLGSGLYNKVTNLPGDIIDTAAEAFGGKSSVDLLGVDIDDREEAKLMFENEARDAGPSEEGKPEYDADAKLAEWDAAKYKESMKKTGKTLGSYKEQPQQKTAVATSNAPKQGISGPKGYGRGEQAEPYEQMQRGMSTGDLEKMLLEAMRSNARMSIFQGGFKGGLL